MLQGIGSLEDIYKNLEAIAPLGFRGSKTLAPKMEDNRELAFLSYQLATIKTDVELDKPCEELKVAELDADKLHALFSRYEFKRWLADVENGTWMDGKGAKSAKVAESYRAPESQPAAKAKPAVPTLSAENYETILDKAQLDRWVKN